MDNIRLRLITDEDTDLIIKWRNNPRVRDNFIYRKKFDRQTHEQWLKNVVGKGLAIQFIIIEIRSLRPVGSVYFSHIDKENMTAEYGIFIGEDDAAGHGYGTEAANAAVAYGFNEMHMKKLYLRVFTDNIAAVKSYEKAGFRKYAVNKDVQCTSGVKKDMFMMSIEKKI